MLALTRAIKSNELHANLEYDPMDFFLSDEFTPEPEPDVTKTTIKVEDLREWLAKHNLKPEFFFPESSNYLDPNHPRYSHKLAAAVDAWLATGDDVKNGMKPKEALEKWLKMHANKYNLLDRETGQLKKDAIDDCAKVANWDHKGGARKTRYSKGL